MIFEPVARKDSAMCTWNYVLGVLLVIVGCKMVCIDGDEDGSGTMATGVVIGFAW